MIFAFATVKADNFKVVNNTPIKIRVVDKKPDLKIINGNLEELSIKPLYVRVNNIEKGNLFSIRSDYVVNIKTKKLSKNTLKELNSSGNLEGYVKSSNWRSGNFWDESYSIEIELTQYFDCYYNIYDNYNRTYIDLIRYNHRTLKIVYLDPQVSAKEVDYYYPNTGDKYVKNSYGEFKWVGREKYSGNPDVLGSNSNLHQGYTYYFYNPSYLYWNFLYELSDIISRSEILLQRGTRKWTIYVESVASGGVIYLNSDEDPYYRWGND